MTKAMRHNVLHRKVSSQTEFLPPTNEVWSKVIFLYLFVILFPGVLPGPGGGSAREGAGMLGCLVWGCLLKGGYLFPGGCVSGLGSVCSRGAWWRPPFPGRLLLWANAFLLLLHSVPLANNKQFNSYKCITGVTVSNTLNAIIP